MACVEWTARNGWYVKEPSFWKSSCWLPLLPRNRETVRKHSGPTERGAWTCVCLYCWHLLLRGDADGNGNLRPVAGILVTPLEDHLVALHDRGHLVNTSPRFILPHSWIACLCHVSSSWKAAKSNILEIICVLKVAMAWVLASLGIWKADVPHPCCCIWTFSGLGYCVLCTGPSWGSWAAVWVRSAVWGKWGDPH